MNWETMGVVTIGTIIFLIVVVRRPRYTGLSGEYGIASAPGGADRPTSPGGSDATAVSTAASA